MDIEKEIARLKERLAKLERRVEALEARPADGRIKQPDQRTW